MNKTDIAIRAAAMLLGAAAIAAPASAQDGRAYGKPAAIEFGGVQDWHAEDNDSVYVRDRAGRWYLATLTAPCPALRFQHMIAFETDPTGRFDRWSAIRTRDQTCAIESLVASPPPAAKGGPRAGR